MGTALYTGVTGLRAHQLRLDVVASDIANVNTIGYRGARVLFQDLFSQTLRGGSAAVGAFGGTNPQQVGLGVNVASIDVNHEQGSLVTTGVASDLAIQGNGFFVLSDGAKTTYTRDGSFSLNPNGQLIEPGTGMRVQGFLADDQGAIDLNAIPTTIEIPLGSAGIVRATMTVNLIGNVNSQAAAATEVTRTIQVYDSLGTAREVTLTFTKQATPANSWAWDATFNGVSVAEPAPPPAPQTLVLQFDDDGSLPDTALGNVRIPGASMNDTGSQPAELLFAIDFSDVTQLSTEEDQTSDVAVRNQDGFPRGVLESFNIGANGEINGVFSNGLTRVVAQVALANFANVGGLVRDGNNTFLETPASGSAQVGAPETGGRGSVNGGVLESSNVDLGTEFSDLIITQRGFQANARTITAADTLLQETVNLVR